MIDVEQSSLLVVRVYNDKIPLFRSCMAKLYKEVNKIGFNQDIISKKEREVFNEVVEAMANESNGS